MSSPERLSQSEIYRLVSDYIGGDGGYLGDFSYKTHAEFYPHYCDLDLDDIDFDKYEGSTDVAFFKLSARQMVGRRQRSLVGCLQGSQLSRFL